MILTGVERKPGASRAFFVYTPKAKIDHRACRITTEEKAQVWARTPQC